MFIAALFLTALIVSIAGWRLTRLISTYEQSTGTPWQRFLAAYSDSLTILWARVIAVVSGAAIYAQDILPVLDPTSVVGGAVIAVLNPKYVPWYMLGMAILFEVFRRRPGSIDRITPPPMPPKPPE